MISKTIAIKIPEGLGARPVAVLVQVASQHESSIHIESNNRKVNAKSIMGMMTLKFREGESVIVSAEGADEAKAVEAIENYLTNAQ